MNYYERHLGDYARDTAHLSILEHGVYNLLLDRYYATESPIPAEQAHRLARARSDDEIKAVDSVLAEFFILIDGVWTNRRADEEIVKAAQRIEAARANGTKGGRPKKNPDVTQQKPTGFSTETQPFSKQNPAITQPLTQTKPRSKLSMLHTPDTTNHQDQELFAQRDSRAAPVDDSPVFVGIPLNGSGEFQVTAMVVAEFENSYPAADVRQELRKMRVWSMSNPKNRKTRAGILRFINNWLAKAHDQGRGSTSSLSTIGPTSKTGLAIGKLQDRINENQLDRNRDSEGLAGPVVLELGPPTRS